MSDVMISVENVSKLYRIGEAETKHESFAGAAMAVLSAPWRNFKRLKNLDTSTHDHKSEGVDLIWALRDVSFEVNQGEVLGIIGRNGAGKSTLLKVLSRVTVPSSGRVRMSGRVSSLLEVGTGFHPELTGRDNVYLNGTILGMTRKEIDRKFDEIVDFSGVEQFLDTPVKRYSSGMKVRLAFAVAAHLEPEVLIIDEVLAVGDADFQRKCLGKMRDISSGEGRTVLFVSHNMGSVAELCDRCVMLEKGTISDDGEPEDVILSYLKRNSVQDGFIDFSTWEGEREGSGKVRLVSVSMVDDQGRPAHTLAYRGRLKLKIVVEGEPGTPFGISVGVKNGTGQLIVNYSSVLDGAGLVLGGDRGEFDFDAGEIPFNDGDYYLTIRLNDRDAKLMDRVNDCLHFLVNSEAYGRVRAKGLVRLSARWTPTGPVSVGLESNAAGQLR